jgi:hypothetical protein
LTGIWNSVLYVFGGAKPSFLGTESMKMIIRWQFPHFQSQKSIRMNSLYCFKIQATFLDGQTQNILMNALHLILPPLHEKRISNAGRTAWRSTKEIDNLLVDETC